MRNVRNIAAAHAARAAVAAQTPVQITAAPSVTSASSQIPAQMIARPNSSPNSFPSSRIGPSTHTLPLNFVSSCKTVKPTQTTCFQPLAALQSTVLQNLYFSTLLIIKTLRSSETRSRRNVPAFYRPTPAARSALFCANSSGVGIGSRFLPANISLNKPTSSP